MDREGAERWLRRLAETELLTGADDGRVRRVAQALVIVGALDPGTADRILDAFELARGGRRPGGAARVLSELMVRDTVAGRMAARRVVLARHPGPGPVIRPVPLGRIIQLEGVDGPAQLYLLSYARVVTGPQFNVVARTRSASGGWEPGGPRLFDSLTATDDRGRTYPVSIRGIGSPVQGWTLMVRSGPSHDPRWLDLASGPAGSAGVRILLTAARNETRPDGSHVTVSPATNSPGEHLLATIAARLLAAVPAQPRDPWLHGPHVRPPDLGIIASGLGDIVTALTEAGALPAASPLPGQLAALCARLGVDGHGITTRAAAHAQAATPARDLPGRWLSVLTQYQQSGSARVPDGCAVATAALPELDGLRLTLLGLHNCAGGTFLHLYGTGPAAGRIQLDPDLYTWPSIWILDGNGRWHVTRVSGQAGADDEVALCLEVLPPLSLADAWIEVRAEGRSGQAAVPLPLSWESFLAS